MRTLVIPLLALFAFPLAACGGSTASTATDDGGPTSGGGPDAAPDVPAPCGHPEHESCNGTCVDILNDPANCGGCGLTCSDFAPGTCVKGTCAYPQATTDAGTPPPNPNGPPPDGTTTTVLAMNQLFLGDTDWNGVPSQSAWKDFGYNIDGLITDRSSTNVCTQAPGASKTMQADGLDGIDNSYGHNILPLILSTAGSDAAKKINDAINAGKLTMLVSADKLGASSSYSGIQAAMMGGASLGAAPKWDGTDSWPVDSTTLVGGNVATPLAAFAGSYMTSRVLVLAPPSGKIILPIGFFPGMPGDTGMPLTHAQLSLVMAGDNKSASHGIVSGVIPTNDFIAYLRKIAGRISTSLCSGSAFDSIAQEIKQAQDIMLDGSNAPGQACDGISLGLGFAAKAVTLGSVVTPPTAPDPCAVPDGGP